jgi:hypothetical protein
VASEPRNVEIGFPAIGKPLKIGQPPKSGFLLRMGDGTKQIWCRMGPGFRGSQPTVGTFVELIGAYIGGDFSFDQVSVLSSPGTPYRR